MPIRPNVLSIAGFDPSGGAGILADIKTFENHKVYGFGVCSAITFQNDLEFENVDWIEIEKIIYQIQVLDKVQDYKFVKIGIIQDIPTLNEITDYINLSNSDIKIIWDPILKSSAGFEFHKQFNNDELLTILSRLYLVTPNADEATSIYKTLGIQTDDELQSMIKEYNLASFLIKGGHKEGNEVVDILIEKEKISVFRGNRYNGHIKHGTGCVLSASITANLANGMELEEACKEAKEYIHKFILSNKILLGYHKDI